VEAPTVSDACTLVCKQAGYEDLATALNAVIVDVEAVPTSTAQIEENGMRKIRLTFPHSSLTFAHSEFKEPGDHVARTLMGMRTFFRRIQTNAVETQQSILQFVLEARALIGVVAQPEYSDDDLHIDTIFAVAEKLGALVFNGAAMLDADGNILLDVDGCKEL
jgi:hypothetical protein